MPQQPVQQPPAPQPPMPQYGAPAPYPQPAPYGQVPAQPGWPAAAPGAFPGAPMAMARPYKESTVAWLLWVFLGMFGAHHFYLGNTNRGIAYAIGWVASAVTTFIVVGFFGFLALFILWIIDAAQMTNRLQQVNAQIFATNRAAGLA
jgi:TM2 domain-containing membrane protein YozV